MPLSNGYLPVSTKDIPEASPATYGLREDEVDFFKNNGYLIVPNALDPTTVQSLVSEVQQMLDNFSMKDHPMTKFIPDNDVKGKPHVGDEYFLNSHDKVRFFFEDDAIDESGNLTKPKNRAINKIGHYLHAKSEAFHKISISPRNAAIAKALGFRDPRVLQSMVICKQPEIGGRVPPHQDSTFLFTDPPSAVGFWYALEDATIHNGCLSFAPGSQKTCPIRRRFIRRDPLGNGKISTAFVENRGTMFPSGVGEEWAAAGGDSDDDDEPADEDYVLAEVKAGSLVLIDGNVMHKSEKNTSDKSRFIYTFHVIEGENEYDSGNWLLLPDGGFSKL